MILGSFGRSFWLWVTRRWDKRSALWMGMVCALFGFLGAPVAHVALELFPIDAPTLPYTLGLFFVFAGLGNGAFMSIPYSMVADTVDADPLAFSDDFDDGTTTGAIVDRGGQTLEVVDAGYLYTDIYFDGANSDLDLYLLDSTGTTVASSEEYNTAALDYEFIDYSVTPGTYYIAISYWSGLDTLYELYVELYY